MSDCKACGKPAPYVGAVCTDCGVSEPPALDWDAILTRVAAVEVPAWVDSPFPAT